MGSNRTFMELKSAITPRLAVAISSSNRTFMELKFTILEIYNEGIWF